MSLRAKLLLAQLPLAFALLVIGAVSRRTVTSLDHSSQEILKDNYLSVLAAQRMRDSADAMARAALARAHGRLCESSSELAARRATFVHELEFQEGNITETGERELTERVRAEWTRFAADFDRLSAMSSVDAPARQLEVYFTALEPRLVSLEDATTQIVTLNQDAMLHKSDGARRHAEWISGAMLAATASAFAIGFLASMFLTNRLTRPLAILAQAVRRLGQGDLEARVLLRGGDEVAEVARELNTMAEHLAQYRSSSLGELLEAQQSAQAAIDSLPDPVLILQLDGALLGANRAASTIFGVDSDADGPAALEHVPQVIHESIESMRQHVISGRGAYVPKGLEEATGVPLRDGVQYFLARANPVQGEQGRVVGLTLLFQDVTRLRRFDELKTDLVATVAHEVRTPLTSLRMSVHLCIEGAAGAVTPKQAELLQGAREDCERLQTIVDDLLDLSRIQNGSIELHRRTISAGSLVAHAVDEQRRAARERSIDLRIGAMTVDRPVFADPERARLVLANLLTNALRHTPTGGTIEVRAAPDEGAVRFEVSDTGAGVAEEFLPRLFERFYRVPGTSGEGAGLGLFICKEIVEAHGGEIGVESDPGHGATFWFTLPSPSSSQS